MSCAVTKLRHRETRLLFEKQGRISYAKLQFYEIEKRRITKNTEWTNRNIREKSLVLLVGGMADNTERKEEPVP